MTGKACLRLTAVLLLAVGGVLLVVCLLQGSVPPPIYGLRYQGEEDYFLHLPVALPFWRELLIAPLISSLIVASAYICKRIDKMSPDLAPGYGFALLISWGILFTGSGTLCLVSNAGPSLSLLFGMVCAFAIVGGVIIIIKTLLLVLKWVFAP